MLQIINQYDTTKTYTYDEAVIHPIRTFFSRTSGGNIHYYMVIRDRNNEGAMIYVGSNENEKREVVGDCGVTTSRDYVRVPPGVKFVLTLESK